MIIEAAEKNFNIGEIPIVFYKRKDGKSRLMTGIFHFAFRAWRLIIRVYTEYHPLKLFLYPILVFFISSAILLDFAFLNYLIDRTWAYVFGTVATILFSTSVILFSIALIADSQKVIS